MIRQKYAQIFFICSTIQRANKTPPRTGGAKSIGDYEMFDISCDLLLHNLRNN